MTLHVDILLTIPWKDEAEVPQIRGYSLACDAIYRFPLWSVYQARRSS